MSIAVFKDRANAIIALPATQKENAELQNMEKVEANVAMEELEEEYAAMTKHYERLLGDVDTSNEEKELCQKLRKKAAAARARGKTSLRRRLMEIQLDLPPRVIEDQVVHVINKREPRVSKFNGDSHQWPAFRDMFIAEVHNRADIESVTKLSILKNACTDQAADTLGLWSHTNDSYVGAWDLLKERYEDAYSIKQSLIRQVFTLPQLKEEKHESLSHMVNMIESVIRQLKNMQVNTDDWDPMLIHMVVSRLPRVTADDWEQRRVIAEEPTLRSLLTYVSGRARGRLHYEYMDMPPKDQSSESHKPKQFPRKAWAYENNQRQSGSGYAGMKRPANDEYHGARGPGSKRFRNESPTGYNRDQRHGKQDKPAKYNNVGDGKGKAKPACRMCNDEHFLYKCPKFGAITIAKRCELLTQWGLCTVCFRAHGKDECNWTGCFKCKGNHHALNCPNKQNRGQMNHSHSSAE